MSLTIASHNVKMFLKISRAVNVDISLCNFGPNWAYIAPKRDFFRKMTKTSFVYLLCLIMPKKLQEDPERKNYETKGCIILAKIGPKLPLP